VPRWNPEAEERLRSAAIELYLEFGYENVTVAQIADRAGLNRRTFSRYFTDKRDVLFAGSDELPPALAKAVLVADANLAPFDVVVAGLTEVGSMLGDRFAPLAAQRRAIIATSPELQERGRTKFAEVSDALSKALTERGAEPVYATLLANVGVAIFQSAFNRWVDDPSTINLADRITEAANELRAGTAQKQS
jgi:AcrR family transcriptional regulator